MDKQPIDRETIEEFVTELHKHPNIRLVKLADYGFVSPLKTSSGALVMAPQIKIVATAFDKTDGVLIRWQSTKQKSSGVSVGTRTLKGRHGDVRVAAKKEDLRKWLELEGYLVSDGEWEPEDIDRLLASR